VRIVGRWRLLFAVRLATVVFWLRSNIIFHPHWAIAVDRSRRRGGYFSTLSSFLSFRRVDRHYIYIIYAIYINTVARTMTVKNSRAHTQTNADISLRSYPIMPYILYTEWSTKYNHIHFFFHNDFIQILIFSISKYII